MSAMLTIQLNNLRFFAPHGVFEEEGKAGNEFEVNISLLIHAPENTPVTLKDTVNYAEVYRLTKDIFKIRKKLLEELAIEIVDAVYQTFPAIQKATIQIIKLHPPIAGFSGSVSVTYDKSFQ
jgi:dihydroneopterin aldolase